MFLAQEPLGIIDNLPFHPNCKPLKYAGFVNNIY